MWPGLNACLPACLQGENERCKSSGCVCVICVLDTWISAGEGVAALALPIPHYSRRPACLPGFLATLTEQNVVLLLLLHLDCSLARSPLACSPAPDCGFHWRLARNCSFFVGGLFKASSELPDVDD